MSWYRLKKTIANSIICHKYPFLKYFADSNRFFIRSCWFDAIDTGWRGIFLQMCEEIKQAMERDDTHFRIHNIKEKDGSLDIDYSAGGEDIDKIIEKYEYISYHTCIVCGRPAFGYTDGWVAPYCKKCAPKHSPIFEFGTVDDPWYDYYDPQKKGDKPVYLGKHWISHFDDPNM